MIALKPDADQIRDFLKKLANDDWVRRSERRFWPLFVFHYTDIRNAVKILRSGFLFSRKYVEDRGISIISSGSSSVLAGTDSAFKDCARLYFRPKTPTQYYAEGIYSQPRLLRSKYPDAHCLVPVFFLFDSATILTRRDCQFSDGGLNSPAARVFSTAKELEKLPWRKIYHTSWYNPDSAEESDIAFRRNAEVIVPQKLARQGRSICGLNLTSRLVSVP